MLPDPFWQRVDVHGDATTSAAADLDVEALAAALIVYGDGRKRLVLPLSRRHEIAAALAAAYAAALAEKGER